MMARDGVGAFTLRMTRPSLLASLLAGVGHQRQWKAWLVVALCFRTQMAASLCMLAPLPLSLFTLSRLPFPSPSPCFSP